MFRFRNCLRNPIFGSIMTTIGVVLTVLSFFLDRVSRFLAEAGELIKDHVVLLLLILISSLAIGLLKALLSIKQDLRLAQMNFGLAYNWPLGAALSAILLVIALSTILVSIRFGALREI